MNTRFNSPNSALDMMYPSLLFLRDVLSEEELLSLTGFDNPFAHPDLMKIDFLEGKTSLSVAQVHQLIAAVALKPYQADHKVVCIYHAHALTLPAQQALLKTLEEPPENTQIILCTQYPHRLLPTILSRLVRSSLSVQKKEQSEHVFIIDDDAFASIIRQNLTVSDAISLASSIGSTKEKAISELLALTQKLAPHNRNTPSQYTIEVERQCHQALSGLHKNYNAKLTLENFLFFACKRCKSMR